MNTSFSSYLTFRMGVRSKRFDTALLTVVHESLLLTRYYFIQTLYDEWCESSSVTCSV